MKGMKGGCREKQRWKNSLRYLPFKDLLANLDAENFTDLTFSHDFKRAATDLTIGSKPVLGNTGIQDYGRGLSAKGARDGFSCFHKI